MPSGTNLLPHLNSGFYCRRSLRRYQVGGSCTIVFKLVGKRNVALMNQAQQKLLNVEERIEAQVQDIRASRDWWPRRRGCDRCCRQLAQPPELSLQKWALLDEAVAALPATIQAEIEQKIDKLLVQIAENTVKHMV